jgi:hypothetical protein
MWGQGCVNEGGGGCTAACGVLAIAAFFLYMQSCSVCAPAGLHVHPFCKTDQVPVAGAAIKYMLLGTGL